MIFGFNTDIKSGNTVYHVQSEARQNERLLQTQIFVRGQCIGKKAASYSDLFDHAEFSEDRMHQMLKSQHKDTVESVRAGDIDTALTRTGAITFADRAVRMLSAGQRRRVALAGVLLANAVLWLLDEPTTNLDADGQQLVRELIAEHLARAGLVVAAVHHPLPLPAEQLVTLEL